MIPEPVKLTRLAITQPSEFTVSPFPDTQLCSCEEHTASRFCPCLTPTPPSSSLRLQPSSCPLFKQHLCLPSLDGDSGWLIASRFPICPGSPYKLLLLITTHVTTFLQSPNSLVSIKWAGQEMGTSAHLYALVRKSLLSSLCAVGRHYGGEA